MRILWIICVGVASSLLAFSWAQTFNTPQLLAISAADTANLPPGAKLSTTFSDVQGRSVTLPSRGRYAAWVVSGVFALEERAAIPEAEVNPQASGGQTLLNPLKVLFPKFPSPGQGQGYVIFTENLPPRNSWAEVQKRWQPYQVYFDTNNFFAQRVPAQGFTGTVLYQALYLLEGQQIQHRYLYWGVWDFQGLTPLISKAVGGFWKGERVVLSPVPIAQATSRIPASILQVDKPTLVIRITGNETEAPKDGIRFSVVDSVGGSTTIPEFKHPASNARFLLEALPPLLRRYNAQGIALVYEGASKIPSLQRIFPGWTFVPMRNAEERLTWLELRSAVVRPGGQVVRPFVLIASSEPDTADLERALQTAR